jgi:hypothetical protein
MIRILKISLWLNYWRGWRQSCAKINTDIFHKISTLHFFPYKNVQKHRYTLCDFGNPCCSKPNPANHATISKGRWSLGRNSNLRIKVISVIAWVQLVGVCRLRHFVERRLLAVLGVFQFCIVLEASRNCNLTRLTKCYLFRCLYSYV